MPIPEEYVYVLVNYQGYLSAIKQFGPIVHPAKVKKSEAIAMMLAGAPVVIYDPATKMTHPLNADNMNEPTKAPKKIPEPMKETVLKGAPKVTNDLGLSEAKKEPELKPEEQVDLTQVIAEQNLSTEPVTEIHVAEVRDEPIPKLLVEDLIKDIQNGIYTESDVIWNHYTKSERRQIRAALNAKNAAVTESND